MTIRRYTYLFLYPSTTSYLCLAYVVTISSINPRLKNMSEQKNVNKRTVEQYIEITVLAMPYHPRVAWERKGKGSNGIIE